MEKKYDYCLYFFPITALWESLEFLSKQLFQPDMCPTYTNGRLNFSTLWSFQTISTQFDLDRKIINKQTPSDTFLYGH